MADKEVTGEPHERLADYMQARRLELGIRTWRALSSEAEIAYETLRALRAGSNPSDATVYDLETALRWEHGSIRRTLAGGGPAPLPERHVQLRDFGQVRNELAAIQEPTMDERVAVLEAEVARLRAVVERWTAEQSEVIAQQGAAIRRAAAEDAGIRRRLDRFLGPEDDDRASDGHSA